MSRQEGLGWALLAFLCAVTIILAIALVGYSHWAPLP